MNKFRFVSFNKQATSKPLDLKWFRAIGADRQVVENCDKARACHEQGDNHGTEHYICKVCLSLQHDLVHTDVAADLAYKSTVLKEDRNIGRT